MVVFVANSFKNFRTSRLEKFLLHIEDLLVLLSLRKPFLPFPCDCKIFGTSQTIQVLCAKNPKLEKEQKLIHLRLHPSERVDVGDMPKTANSSLDGQHDHCPSHHNIPGK